MKVLELNPKSGFRPSRNDVGMASWGAGNRGWENGNLAVWGEWQPWAWHSLFGATSLKISGFWIQAVLKSLSQRESTKVSLSQRECQSLSLRESVPKSLSWEESAKVSLSERECQSLSLSERKGAKVPLSERAQDSHPGVMIHTRGVMIHTRGVMIRTRGVYEKGAQTGCTRKVHEKGA